MFFGGQKVVSEVERLLDEREDAFKQEIGDMIALNMNRSSPGSDISSDELMTQIRRHNSNIDNLIDTLDSNARLEKTYKRKTRAFRERESMFLALFETQLDLFWSLKRSLSEDEAWAEQFESMGNMLKEKQDACGIAVIDSIGIQADYLQYEIIKTEKTDDREKDGLITEVIVPGYMYQAEVKRKAKAVCARYSG